MIFVLLFTCTAIFSQAEVISVPELTLVQQPIPENEAMALMKKLKVGWNLGNTLDATSGSNRGNELEIEKSWCGVYTTREMIAAVKNAGFETIRIPVSWHNHVSAGDFTINPAWLDRVQEIVDYAISEGLYVILNAHHDNDQKYYYPTEKCYENSAKYLTAIWSQVAERFRDYDEHLIFESMNEPRLSGTPYEWNFSKGQAACRKAAECINRLNQVFVDTVRAGGGYNQDRYLSVPGYAAAPNNAVDMQLFTLPEDTAENRIIVSVHAYTPYSFALQDGGMSRFEPSNAQRSEIGALMNSLYNRFVKNGIPVIIGEFGARDKKNLQDRVNYYAFYVGMASARNIPCIVWDNHGFSGGGELFGLLDRKNLTFKQPILVDAITRYAGYDTLPAS